MVSETKIRPQTLLLKVSSSPSELVPSFSGMLWLDSNNILRVDSVGAGVPVDFVTVLPEHTISGNHGPKVNITQTAADNALAVVKSNVNAAISVSCISANAGRAIDIVSVSTASAAAVVSSNGNVNAVEIYKNAVGAGNGLQITNSGSGNGISVLNQGTGFGIYVGNTSTSYGIAVNQYNGGSPGIFVNQLGNNTGCEILKSNINGGTALLVENAGTGIGLFVGQSGEGVALQIDKTTSGTSNALIVNNTGTGASVQINQKGNGIALDVNKTDTGNANTVNIINSGSGAGMHISQVGAGTGLLIEQNGNDNALNIVQVGNDNAVGIIQNGADTALVIEKVSTSAHNALLIDSSGANDVVAINSNGTTGSCLELAITNVGNIQSVISITNNGSGNDIRGTSGSWSVNKNGDLTVRSLSYSGTASSQFKDLFGQVAANGSIQDGASGGWTSVKNATGTYTVTFSPTFFSVAPTIMVTPIPGSDTIRTAYIGARSISSFVVYIRNNSGNLNDTPFDFIARGRI